MSDDLRELRRRAMAWTEEPAVPLPRCLRGNQWSLRGLFILVALAAVCCALATIFGAVIGALLFVTAIALRTAVVDFTWRGDVAAALVMLCGAASTLLFVSMAVHH